MNELRAERRGRTGLVTLDRPAALNALTHDMVVRLDAVLRDWAADRDIERVVVAGAGERAFCAGGDVRALYEARGRQEFLRRFYFDEYRLDRAIFRFPRPYIALIDGIVMGGGAGVSINGRVRVVTEKALFAMPETGIGLFPDVGASHFLSRCPGRIGLYLGLSGARLNAADMVYAGLATHYVPRARLEAVIEGGSELDRLAGDPGPSPLATLRPVIDRCFAGPTVEGFLDALDREGGEWAGKTAAAIRAKSPLALKVTQRQLALGAALDFEDCLRMEARLVQSFMRGDDFFEGVRALLIDKDMAPRWNPATLSGVSDALVDACFDPPAAEGLTFP